MNTLPTPPSQPDSPLTPGEDLAMDALLHEYSRAEAADDAAFLVSFEARFAKEAAVETSAVTQPSRKPLRFSHFVWPTAIAATVAAGLYFQNTDSGRFRLASSDSRLNEPLEPSKPMRQTETFKASDEAQGAAMDGTAGTAGFPGQSRALLKDARFGHVPDEKPSDQPVFARAVGDAAAESRKGEGMIQREMTSGLSTATANSPIPGKEVARLDMPSGRQVARLDMPSAAKADTSLQPMAEADSSQPRMELANRVMLGYFDNRSKEKSDQLQDSEGYRWRPSSAAAPVAQNPFLTPRTSPLSTLSVDVDTASYANIRSMLQRGTLPPPQLVRVEEMLNYFHYAMPEPQEHPVGVFVESSPCPWQPEHRLVRLGMKAKEISAKQRPTVNLVFLIDVSGSMQGPDRLDLVKENLKVLTNGLQPDDTVAIAVYAGSEGIALPPTSGADKETIRQKLESLASGGSTNGAAGITLAYQTARSRFLKEGVNRVVLCTDGDFNVGLSGTDELVKLVKKEAEDGIFLTVCGYGQGNLNDTMLEAITNKGNGVYNYIDSAREGRKVFQDQLLGTLVTVAKDVKLQVEFNPAQVASYRLIGYENRLLAKEDFVNDKVDAGDVGAGHRVTALYEVIPAQAALAAVEKANVDLKYQKQEPEEIAAHARAKAVVAEVGASEMLTVKVRYKLPTSTESVPFELPFQEKIGADVTASPDQVFAGVVAEFGQSLRGSLPEGKGRTAAQLREAAESTRGEDPHGHRAEFIELIRSAERLQGGLK